MLAKPSPARSGSVRTISIVCAMLLLGIVFTGQTVKAQSDFDSRAPWQLPPDQRTGYQPVNQLHNTGNYYGRQTAYTPEAIPLPTPAESVETTSPDETVQGEVEQANSSLVYGDSSDCGDSGSCLIAENGCNSTCELNCGWGCVPIFAPLEDRLWVSAEYLAWWNKPADLPALVTTSPIDTPLNQAGVLGQPETSILFGGGNLNQGVSSGGRITLGYWLNPCQDFGLEIVYTFLGNKSTGFNQTSQGDPILARPFFNVNPGSIRQDADIVAYPNYFTGSLDVSIANEFQSIEVLSRRTLIQNCNRQLDFLIGGRYSRFAENLMINESSTSINQVTPVPIGTVTQITDQFSANNEFYGAEIGFAAKTKRCRLSMELLAKMAMGSTRSRVTVDGSTVVTVPTQTPITYSGGILALPTNIGAYDRNNFTVIPELGITMGYDITCRLKASVGYSFLYWSKVVRPGDQIDMNVNSSQFPPGTLSGVSAPVFNFTTTDFWTQGLNFGLDYSF
jgi:hypothetical protein